MKKTDNKKDPKAAAAATATAKDPKAKDVKDTKDAKKPLLDKKGKPIIEPEEEIKELPPPEKEKNLGRFIYITTFADTSFMKNLKEVFEEINKEAFKLKSVKEIYTITLSPEDQDNNEIDYISGFQLIDVNFRITIIEGINDKAMKIVRDRFPKTDVNSHNKKIFSNSSFVYNKRLYSPFNLCVKFIKLRDTLQSIITTADIYTKSVKYKSIFDTFMKLGSINQSKSLQEISDAGMFPEADSLLLLERKYADILNDEDLTGIRVEKKKKKKLKIRDSSDTLTYEKSNSMITSTLNKSVDTVSKTRTNALQSESKNSDSKPTHNLRYEENKDNIKIRDDDLGIKVKKTLKQKTDSFNPFFEGRLKERVSLPNICHQRNLDLIAKYNENAHTDKYYTRQINEDFPKNEEVYLYSSQRKNYFLNYMDKLREKYEKDKSHYYTFSNQYLTLSFPYSKVNNAEYEAFVENRKKWLVKEGFNRYKTLTKEYVYIPKINNEI